MQRRRKKVTRGVLTQVEIKEVVLDGDQGLVEGGWNFSSPICDDGEGGGSFSSSEAWWMEFDV